MPAWPDGNLVDSHTELYGVIGDPIRHSKSPIMMNRAFRACAVNGIYTAFHIAPGKVGDFITGVRAMGIRGVNVTIPHKLEVMQYLDAIDASAEAIGAVNTIVNENGRLTGYNTDGIGYVRSLKEEVEPQLAGKRVLILGAGGAARGIVFALMKEQPAQITIVNRTMERAAQLADDFNGQQQVRVFAEPMEQLQMICEQADLVINTTSIGMYPKVDDVPLDAALLQPGAIASDLIYNPMHTRFLQEAQQKGCPVHGGLGMFIYQGAYAFEYWTGQPAPVVAMRASVLEALGK